MKKKLFFILLFFVMSLYGFAQSGPISLMGIPLTGNIGSFHEQMLSKGMNYQVERDNYRFYKGLYDGKQSSIFVFFDKNTRNVKGAEVVINCTNKDNALTMYNDYKEIIEYRYNPNMRFTSTNKDGMESIDYYKTPAVISLSINHSDVDYQYPYKLVIDFSIKSE